MTSTAHPPGFDEPPADRSAGPPPLDVPPLTDRIFVVDRTLGVEVRCPSRLATPPAVPSSRTPRPRPAPRPRQASALVVRPSLGPSSAPALPAPTATGPATTRRPEVVDQPARPAAPDGELANQLATVLAGVLKVDSVPLDGHFFDDLGADSLLMAQFCARLRKRPDLPTVSIKDVYQHSTITALAAATGGSGGPAATRPRTGPAAASGLASELATVLAGVLKVDSVPLDGHFFDDLDADSLLMAQFCARLRKRPDLPTVSIKDIYRHSTITALAAATGED